MSGSTPRRSTRERRVPRQLPAGPRPPGADQRRRHACRKARADGLAAGALAGGFIGTLVLTTGLRAATEFRLTRIDLPFLLGTVFTADRARARALGYVLHFLFGLLFACVYYLVFAALDRPSWWLGALLGSSMLSSRAPRWSAFSSPWSIRGWGRPSAPRIRHRCSSRPGSCSSTTARALRWSCSCRTSSMAQSWARRRLPESSTCRRSSSGTLPAFAGRP